MAAPFRILIAAPDFRGRRGGIWQDERATAIPPFARWPYVIAPPRLTYPQARGAALLFRRPAPLFPRATRSILIAAPVMRPTRPGRAVLLARPRGSAPVAGHALAGPLVVRRVI